MHTYVLVLLQANQDCHLYCEDLKNQVLSTAYLCGPSKRKAALYVSFLSHIIYYDTICSVFVVKELLSFMTGSSVVI